MICEAFLRGVRRYVFPEKNVLFGGYVGTFLRFSVIFFLKNQPRNGPFLQPADFERCFFGVGRYAFWGGG